MKKLSDIFLPLVLLFVFTGCNGEKPETGEKPNAEISSDEKEKPPVQHKNENYAAELLENAEFHSPLQDNYEESAKGNISIKNDKNFNFQITISYSDGSKDELEFSGKNLVAQVSSLSFNQAFHQKLSVYLFEKQWHRDSVKGSIYNKSIWRYEIVNPPQGNQWYLNALVKNGEKEKVAASYLIKIPEAVYTSIFKSVNPSSDTALLAYRFKAPESEKIQYNSLRKLGKFYEGVLGNLNTLPLELPEIYQSHVFLQKNPIKTMAQLYEQEFNFPHSDEDRSYDTSHVCIHSLSELYYIKSFSYKTAYPLNGSKDSTLEMQIDFKTRDHAATIRFVMGGIVMSELPRLKSNEIEKGMYFPIGFSKYKNKSLTQEAYVMMGNTSGLWSDNTLGRNIDGVVIYLDKIQKAKVHIWIIGGDGTLPVAHYVALLDKIIK